VAAATPIGWGEPAPWVTAPTAGSPEFALDTAAGRYILLLFLPPDPEHRGRTLKALAANQALFDDVRISAFVVMGDPGAVVGARDMRGLRWYHDGDGAIGRRFGAEGADAPAWMLLDPTLRVMGHARAERTESVFETIRTLPQPADHAGVSIVAPVLIAPRIFDPDLCARLIALLDGGDAAFSGVMRDIGDRTEAVMDEHKRRRDVTVTDPDLCAEVRQMLAVRLFPQIRHAFQFQVTEIERDLIACYDAADGGVFRAHRDNTTRQTANRKFACSINLNDGFAGGDLRFPEFGKTLHRPPPGGAVVFSCALLHEVTPVTRGRRYAFLPFFYDQDGARILEAYRRSIAERAE
jgi:predicted 2-oxoglutarate/Fe(II)-dependent dioxygenase YbiX